MLQRWLCLLPAMWAGALICVAGIATPAPFATLATVDAGRVVARVLAQEAWLSLAMALLLLAMERRVARERAAAGQGSVLSTEMLMLLGTLFCTVAGYFGIQPLLPAARAGLGAFSFGQLHAGSTVLFGIKVLLVLGLAWRASRRCA
ncbi:MAG: DUF4149 domain-containing protein [Burkholderiales bacterium]|nr:DUF4149 domain-containing protein [Burkholderiales bacterium]